MPEWIIWGAAAVSFYATWINADKNRLCWVLWMMTNTFWATHFFRIGQYAPAVLQVGYCGLSMRGFWLWKPGKQTNTDETEMKDTTKPPPGYHPLPEDKPPPGYHPLPEDKPPHEGYQPVCSNAGHWIKHKATGRMIWVAGKTIVPPPPPKTGGE